MSIRYIIAKSKFLVVVTAFLLISALSASIFHIYELNLLQKPITISPNEYLTDGEKGGLYVASKSGKKYYFPWCGNALRFTPDKKLWFKSREAAEAAGFQPAQNCFGLIPK